MNEYALALDLAKAKQRQQQTIFVRQGDRNATTIVATIYDHGAAAATSGLAARFQMRLPNGTEYYRKAASLSGNVATVALDETQAASVAGRTDVAYFQLLQGSTVVASTESFTVVVLPDALADAEVAESYDSAIQDAIDALDAAVADMPDMVEDVLEAHPEWTTTVQDGSITKAKLGTDLARDRERLLYRLDNMLTNALPEGDVATATDAAKTPLAGLTVYGSSTQDGTPTPSAPVPIVSVAPDSQGNISLWARGKNLLPFPYYDASPRVQNGITFTVNADGSVTMSGTATGTAFYNFANHLQGYVWNPDTYTVSVDSPLPTGVEIYFGLRIDGTNKHGVYLRSGSSSVAWETQDVGLLRGYITVSAGATVNATLYPQLEAGSTTHTYEPYTATVTPIPLDGHELRSLPDGTRDELTVDARGHAVLVQRVVEVQLTSTNGWSKSGSATNGFYKSLNSIRQNLKQNTTNGVMTPIAKAAGSATEYFTTINSAYVDSSLCLNLDPAVVGSTVAEFTAWLAANQPTVCLALATPVTHDLGAIDPVPLLGPDLTAQAVPTAPFALTYERDLDATLARLESAIANLV